MLAMIIIMTFYVIYNIYCYLIFTIPVRMGLLGSPLYRCQLKHRKTHSGTQSWTERVTEQEFQPQVV